MRHRALPAFVLTTTTPLVSGWFATARDPSDEGDPYWLYALSNGGSLLALLAYPIVIEPRLGLTAQRGLWTVGYAALVVMLSVAAMRRPARSPAGSRAAAERGRGRSAAPAASRRGDAIAPIDWPRRLRWLLLAAIPSGLLSAVTTFIATDLVSAPLLWVAPLAIYLASFIIAFSPRGGWPVRLAALAAPAMITLLWVPYGSAGGWPMLVVLAMELVAFGIVAVALHGRLAQDRPDPSPPDRVLPRSSRPAARSPRRSSPSSPRSSSRASGSTRSCWSGRSSRWPSSRRDVAAVDAGRSRSRLQPVRRRVPRPDAAVPRDRRR